MLLIKHSSLYILARGIPGLINFMAVALYTRFLSPEEYGRYILVLAGVGFFNVVFFQWLKLSLLRFLPANSKDFKPLLSTVLIGFASLVCLTGVVGLLIAWLWPAAWRNLILLAVLLLWAQSWFDLNLELARGRFHLWRYGLMSMSSSITALTLGLLMVLWGLGAYAPIIGLLVGLLLAGIWWGERDEWKEAGLSYSRPLLRDLLQYGFPLTATFALAFIVSASDRFLIANFLGERFAGIYAAGYDLAQQSLTYLMMMVNLAAYPLAVRALERQGTKAAQEQVRQSGTLLAVISFPAVVGLVVLAPNVTGVLLGADFRQEAATILPWIAVATLVSGLRAYHFDLAFQLGRHTVGQVWVVGIAAVVNLVLNLWWIPIYGTLGAAYATLSAYLLALLASIVLGRRIFLVPIPLWDGLKAALASLIMGLLIWPSLKYQGLYALAVQVLSGGLIYLVLLGLFNVGGYRTEVLRRIALWKNA